MIRNDNRIPRHGIADPTMGADFFLDPQLCLFDVVIQSWRGDALDSDCDY
jgi:hypothetical protein